MYSSKTSERPPRTMLIAGQNETVRKTVAQSGFPATVGLQGCVAVIIRCAPWKAEGRGA